MTAITTDPAALARISTALGAKLTQPCPACGGRSFSHGHGVITLPIDHPTPGNTSRAYPLLPACCNDCGCVMMFNVYTLGIADIWPDIVRRRAVD